MNPPLPPAELARCTVEALRLEHGAGRTGMHGVLVALAAVGLAALALVQVDVAVTAAGIVRPATERIELRAPATGRIAAVAVRENGSVAAGDLLLAVATPELDERLARNRRLQAERRALLERLETLSTVRAAEVPALNPIRSGRTVETLPALRTLDQEWRELQAHLAAQRVAQARAQADRDRVEALARAGLAPPREVDEARFAVARVEAETTLRIEQALTRWQLRREETSAALGDLVAEEALLEASRAAAELRAPVDGTVLGLAGLGVGTPVGAGQALGSLSPDDRLVVETRVSSRDIAALRPRQPVRLQVDAFPYTAWGSLEGSVLEVAADAERVGAAGAAVFKVLVAPRSTTLARRDGRRGELGRGMTVTARFLTTRRSLLEILHQGAGDWLDPRQPRSLPPAAAAGAPVA